MANWISTRVANPSRRRRKAKASGRSKARRSSRRKRNPVTLMASRRRRAVRSTRRRAARASNPRRAVKRRVARRPVRRGTMGRRANPASFRRRIARRAPRRQNPANWMGGLTTFGLLAGGAFVGGHIQDAVSPMLAEQSPMIQGFANLAVGYALVVAPSMMDVKVGKGTKKIDLEPLFLGAAMPFITQGVKGLLGGVPQAAGMLPSNMSGTTQMGPGWTNQAIQMQGRRRVVRRAIHRGSAPTRQLTTQSGYIPSMGAYFPRADIAQMQGMYSRSRNSNSLI